MIIKRKEKNKSINNNNDTNSNNINNDNKDNSNNNNSDNYSQFNNNISSTNKTISLTNIYACAHVKKAYTKFLK